MFKIIKYLILFAIIFVGAGVGYALVITKNLPDPKLFDQRQISQSTKIYDRTSKVSLYEIHGEEKRTIIPFEEIPDYVKQATLTIEDSQFYNHPAFDWRSIIRAVFINLSRGKVVQGGSTITQQLAKNTFLTPEKTITRKIKELALSFQLEKKYSKDEIFDLYLNQIPYGSNAYGIESAAQTFFNKHAKDLTLAESTLLASLPNAPSYYSPYGVHTDELTVRQNYILEQMEQAGYIDAEERQRAQSQKLEFAPQAVSIKAPHFVIAIQDYLNNKYGEDFVQKAGLIVTSTLDWDLQQLAETTIANGAARNSELYGGNNASLVAQDAKTGQILALVGSKDYFDMENDGNFNVAIQGLRQPGSAIKPFAYITAFKKGYTPDTIIFDVPTNFDTTGSRPYEPNNFDDRFRGPVTLREGLAQSINVPSVKTLFLANIADTLQIVADFGITTLTERSRYGLSLALGGGEVKLIEIVGAYSVFSQEGIKHQQSLILEIKDNEGNILEKYNDEAKEVIEPAYARLINDILSDVEVRKSLYQNSLYLTIFPNQEVALKTGTTNDYRDAWAIGYSPSLVVGVWAGNNDNTPMRRQGSSILAALPIWHDFLEKALPKFPQEVFTRPEPIVTDKPMFNGEYIINGEIHNILHYINKNSSQYKNWEDGLINWLQTNPEIINTKNIPSTGAAINIKSPINGDFIKNNQLRIDADLATTADIIKIEIILNNKIIGQKADNLGKIYNYREDFQVKDLKPQNTLKIKVLDSSSRETEKEIILYTR